MDHYLTPRDVAEILVVSTETLQRWRKESPAVLPFSKVGRQVRYTRTAVENFIHAQQQVA